MSFKKEKYLLTERKYALLDCEGIDSKTQTQEEQEVYGVLTLPSNLSDKIPLIIGVAGSKDWASHHREYMTMYRIRFCNI